MPSPEEFNSQVETERRERMRTMISERRYYAQEEQAPREARTRLAGLTREAASLLDIGELLAEEASEKGIPPTVRLTGYSTSVSKREEIRQGPILTSRLGRASRMGMHTPITAVKHRKEGEPVMAWIIRAPERQPDGDVYYPNLHGLALTEDGEVVAYSHRMGPEKPKKGLLRRQPPTPRPNPRIAEASIEGELAMPGEFERRYNFAGFGDARSKNPVPPADLLARNIEAVRVSLIDFATQIR